jgi:hypothetical protein
MSKEQNNQKNDKALYIGGVRHSFIENIKLDAGLVFAGMKGGMDGIMNFAFARKQIFTTTDMVTDRCEWLKKQSKEYTAKVSTKAAELERKANCA